MSNPVLVEEPQRPIQPFPTAGAGDAGGGVSAAEIRDGGADETQLPDDSPNQPALSVFNPPLEWLVSLSEAEFSALFRKSPVKRAKYRGMLRNVATAMGNSGDLRYRPLIEKLAEYPDEVVQKHARWGMGRLGHG